MDVGYGDVMESKRNYIHCDCVLYFHPITHPCLSYHDTKTGIYISIVVRRDVRKTEVMF